MNPPVAAQRDGQKSVHAETIGVAVPTIQIAPGLRADRAKLRARVSTVCKYLKGAEAADAIWPLPEGWDDARVEAELVPRNGIASQRQKSGTSQPDFAAMHDSCGNRVISPCNCFGKNADRPTRGPLRWFDGPPF
jgi:hypothetical protein